MLQKELDYLDGAVANPKRPFVAIVGGSKACPSVFTPLMPPPPVANYSAECELIWDDAA